VKINSICIVGGGSSGWMMAIALQKKLPKIKVTLVESPNVPIIGVGEATIPYTANFFEDILGFKEKEWMPYCDATYKAAIRFRDFSSKGEDFYHPFWNREEDTYNGFDWAVKRYLTKLDIEDYYSSNYIAYHMSKNNKFSRLEDEGFKYAHHLDAIKFAQFCKSKFEGEHILATVGHVETDGTNIISVATDKGKIKADMFVDCTGFKALLIDQTLHEPFDSTADTLLNDTALTCRMPYENKTKELEPFTDCTALSSGWAWNTPIWSRIGTGYVFSSQFQTEESATKEFKKYLTDRFGKVRSEKAEFNTIKFKTGKYRRGWVGNCLSLTLASGFIEPLESTGLALACYQIEDFIEKIKDYECSTFKRNLYNTFVDNIFKETQNFVLLHYVNSKREDSAYWRYIKNDIPIPTLLTDYIQSPQHYTCFGFKSRECIFIGLNIPSAYSDRNLSWNSKHIDKHTQNEQTSILEGIKYIDDRKNYYQSKIKGMTGLEDYLKQEVYI
jgi:tryptophan halogenase